MWQWTRWSILMLDGNTNFRAKLRRQLVARSMMAHYFHKIIKKHDGRTYKIMRPMQAPSTTSPSVFCRSMHCLQVATTSARMHSYVPLHTSLLAKPFSCCGPPHVEKPTTTWLKQFCSLLLLSKTFQLLWKREAAPMHVLIDNDNRFKDIVDWAIVSFREKSR